MAKALSKLQKKTLDQIRERPGFYKVACSQAGFSLTSAASLKKRGLVEWRKHGGSPYGHWYPSGY